jgi:hypothetical protein
MDTLESLPALTDEALSALVGESCNQLWERFGMPCDDVRRAARDLLIARYADAVGPVQDPERAP